MYQIQTPRMLCVLARTPRTSRTLYVLLRTPRTTYMSWTSPRESPQPPSTRARVLLVTQLSHTCSNLFTTYLLNLLTHVGQLLLMFSILGSDMVITRRHSSQKTKHRRKVLGLRHGDVYSSTLLYPGTQPKSLEPFITARTRYSKMCCMV